MADQTTVSKFLVLCLLISACQTIIFSQNESDKLDQDWPQFLGPNRNGKSPFLTTPSKWNKIPKINWKVKIGEGYSSPIISKDKLFIFGRHRHSARLTCYNSDTGQELWQFNYITDYVDLLGYNNGPRSSPVVDENRVYIFGVEGILHCLDTSKGQLIWSNDTSEQFNVIQNFFGVGSSPIILDKLLIVPVGGSKSSKASNIYSVKGELVGNNSAIVAFDKLTGKIVYQISNELASYASPVLTQIGSKQWGFAFMRGGLIGFDPLKGVVNFHFRWRAKKFESVNASSPVVINDDLTNQSTLVFVSEASQIGSAMLRVSNKGYQVLWKDGQNSKNQSLMLHWNTAIHHKGFLYGCSGQYNRGSQLRCIDILTGEVKWSETVNERMSLTAVGDNIISLSEFGTLILFQCNPTHFKPYARHSLKESIGLKYPAWAAPVIANGFLYLRDRSQLYCFDLP